MSKLRTPVNDPFLFPFYLKLIFRSNGQTFPSGTTYLFDTNLSPIINSLSATSGSEGDQITITGTGFGTTQSMFKNLCENYYYILLIFKVMLLLLLVHLVV